VRAGCNRPQGFDASDIAVPVEVRYGARNVLVPATHGAWLARSIPCAIVVVEEDQGHMGDLNDIGALTRWLVSGV
jgi:pimeloyl-ACP methyl ester carboxylesterase